MRGRGKERERGERTGGEGGGRGREKGGKREKGNSAMIFFKIKVLQVNELT